MSIVTLHGVFGQLRAELLPIGFIFLFFRYAIVFLYLDSPFFFLYAWFFFLLQGFSSVHASLFRVFFTIYGGQVRVHFLHFSIRRALSGLYFSCVSLLRRNVKALLFNLGVYSTIWRHGRFFLPLFRSLVAKYGLFLCLYRYLYYFFLSFPCLYGLFVAKVFFFLMKDFYLLLFLLFPHGNVRATLRVFVYRLYHVSLLYRCLSLTFRFFLRREHVTSVFPSYVSLFIRFHSTFTRAIVFLTSLFPYVHTFFRLFVYGFRFFLCFALLKYSSLYFRRGRISVVVFRLVLLFWVNFYLFQLRLWQFRLTFRFKRGVICASRVISLVFWLFLYDHFSFFRFCCSYHLVGGFAPFFQFTTWSPIGLSLSGSQVSFFSSANVVGRF